MEPLCLGKATDPGRTGGDNRLFLEAVLWIARTGSPWRDLPPTFGSWNTVFKRYRDWVKAGVADFRCGIGWSGYGVRHGRRDNRQSSPPRAGSKRGTKNQAIGKSKGGWTTKILALTDALGNLVRFILLPGHRFDTVGVAPLIKDLEFGGLIADKAFDSNWIIEDMNERKAKVVIAQHQRRAKPLDIDKDIYKWRHLIENFFGKLKEFKRVAMRCDKTDSSFEAMIYLATAVIHSRWISTGPSARSWYSGPLA
jgi:transposase